MFSVCVRAQSLKELSWTDKGGHMSGHTFYNLGWNILKVIRMSSHCTEGHLS